MSLTPTKSWEGARVGDVEAATLAATVAAVSTEASPKLSAATTTTSASTLASTITSELASAATPSAASAASWTTIASIGGNVVLPVKLQRVLGLLMLLALGFATRPDHEVLLIWVARKLTALWELLLRTLVGFTCLESAVTESQALLGLFGQILIIRLRLVLRLCSRILTRLLTVGTRASVSESWIGATRVWCKAWLILGLGSSNVFAGLLVIPFSIAILCTTPAVRCLLLVVAVKKVSLVSNNKRAATLLTS